MRICIVRRSRNCRSEDGYVAGNPRWAAADRLVVVSGCSGGGKSALIAEMAARGYRIFPEPGRQVVKEEALIGGEALPWPDPRRFAERCIARASVLLQRRRPEAPGRCSSTAASSTR